VNLSGWCETGKLRGPLQRQLELALRRPDNAVRRQRKGPGQGPTIRYRCEGVCSCDQLAGLATTLLRWRQRNARLGTRCTRIRFARASIMHACSHDCPSVPRRRTSRRAILARSGVGESAGRDRRARRRVEGGPPSSGSSRPTVGSEMENPESRHWRLAFSSKGTGAYGSTSQLLPNRCGVSDAGASPRYHHRRVIPR
jgi:hypothetical protein